MAQGVFGVQLLQGRRRSHDECSVSCSNELLHPTWPERVGPFDDSSVVATSRPARPRQHLHPLQDSDHDTQLIHWRYWWTRWGPRRGRDGHTGRDVIALTKGGRNERRDDERGNESYPGNYPSRRALPGAIRGPIGDEYVLEGDRSCARRRLYRAVGTHLQE